MKKIIPVMGALTAGFAASAADSSTEGLSSGLRDRGPNLLPSAPVAQILGSKMETIQDRQVAFGETFPDKFAEKGAFSNFHKPQYWRWRTDPYRYRYRIQPQLQLPRVLPQYQRSEAAPPTVKQAFERFKPS